MVYCIKDWLVCLVYSTRSECIIPIKVWLPLSCAASLALVSSLSLGNGPAKYGLVWSYFVFMAQWGLPLLIHAQNWEKQDHPTFNRKVSIDPKSTQSLVTIHHASLLDGGAPGRRGSAASPRPQRQKNDLARPTVFPQEKAVGTPHAPELLPVGFEVPIPDQSSMLQADVIPHTPLESTAPLPDDPQRSQR
jgi:hypothetical protein